MLQRRSRNEARLLQDGAWLSGQVLQDVPGGCRGQVGLAPHLSHLSRVELPLLPRTLRRHLSERSQSLVAECCLLPSVEQQI